MYRVGTYDITRLRQRAIVITCGTAGARGVRSTLGLDLATMAVSVARRSIVRAMR